jgi:hypothetical protein
MPEVDVLRMKADSVPKSLFRYSREAWLHKSSGEMSLGVVARHATSDLVVWLRFSLPEGGRHVYVLIDGMLAKLYVTDVGAENGGSLDGDEWIVGAGARHIWTWRGPQLPDGVRSDRLIDWNPFFPPDFSYAELALARRIIERIHPALVWWPDKVDRQAVVGDVVPPRERPHLIRYPGLQPL